MNVLVTGSNGFIGKHIVKQLKKENIKVIKFDLSNNKDITKRLTLDKTFRTNKIDVVIHTCALAIVSESNKNPFDYFKVNVEGTHKLLETMKKYNVRKIIFSSTGAAIKPNSIYGLTKSLCETIIKFYHDQHKFQYFIFRFFNVIGTGEKHNPETHLFPNLVDAILKDKYFELYGDGNNVRDYIDVRDIANAHILAVKSSKTGSYTLQLGRERGYSVNQIIRKIENATGKKVKIKKQPAREGEDKFNVSDITLSRTILNWKPKILLDQSIIDVIKDRNHG